MKAGSPALPPDRAVVHGRLPQPSALREFLTPTPELEPSLALATPPVILEGEAVAWRLWRQIAMPYCPDCRYEYLAGVDECPDCDEPLVEALPRPDHRPFRLVEIYRGRSPEVRILEEALRQEGIPSLVRPVEPLMGLIGDLALAVFSQLLVSTEIYESQQPIIDDCLQFVGR